MGKGQGPDGLGLAKRRPRRAGLHDMDKMRTSINYSRHNKEVAIQNGGNERQRGTEQDVSRQSCGADSGWQKCDTAALSARREKSVNEWLYGQMKCCEKNDLFKIRVLRPAGA